MAFVWKLATKVELLEQTLESREKDIERRHLENLAAGRHLDMQLARLTERIDRFVDRPIGH